MVRKICNRLNWKYLILVSRLRTGDIVSQRKCISIALYDLGLSYREIGKLLMRDRTTIRYAVHGKLASEEEIKLINEIKNYVKEARILGCKG